MNNQNVIQQKNPANSTSSNGKDLTVLFKMGLQESSKYSCDP